MPSHLHETLIEMFRDRPLLAAELLRGPLHVAVPDFDEARLSSADLTDVTPTEYRADAVVTLTDEGLTVLAVVVEVQLRIAARKRRTWPAYVANLHARLGCPVALMVVCPAQPVAEWCAAPIPPRASRVRAGPGRPRPAAGAGDHRSGHRPILQRGRGQGRGPGPSSLCYTLAASTFPKRSAPRSPAAPTSTGSISGSCRRPPPKASRTSIFRSQI
jgi:hypothetical protein